MSNQCVRLWVAGNQNDARIHPIETALRGCGIQLEPVEPQSSCATILVLLNEVTEDILQGIRELDPTDLSRILVITPDSRPPDGVWRLLGAGVSEVISWGSMSFPASKIAARLERWRQIDELVVSQAVRTHLAGQSPIWTKALRSIVEVAAFSNASILLCGETGTGKEQIARVIHALDLRPNKRGFVVCDCSTIVSELSGSEFFGHERGAFTGAVSARDGAFATADGGTLFLDEIGELPLPLQSQLLRVIQERTYKRVGGNIWYQTNFRLVCATNRDLVREMSQQQFRTDLYYRIANFTCQLPPLRERPEDIPTLVDHFLSDLAPEGRVLELDEPVRQYLQKRNYVGNVRELRQLMARMLACHVGNGPITVGDIPVYDRPREQLSLPWPDYDFHQAVRRGVALGVGLRDIGRIAADAAIDAALGCESGNLQRAARRLGVTDRALQLRRAQKGTPTSNAPIDSPGVAS